MRRVPPASSVNPRRLTALIGQAEDVWTKLAWEAARMQEAREARSRDIASLVYGAINFAVTSVSLEDWFYKLSARRIPISRRPEDFRRAVCEAIPMQSAFRDIANTFKHGAYRDENWKGGTVEVVFFPAFSGTPRELILTYHSQESGAAQTSIEVFDEVLTQWGRFVEDSGLIRLLGRV